MKLGELKKSLARMSPDLDDCEVLLNYQTSDGKSDYDNLAFTAYAELPQVGIVCMLGSMKEACELFKKKTLKNPDGTSLSEEGFNLNGSES